VEIYLKTLDEYPIEGKPLGRHIEHDEASRNFAWEKQGNPIHSIVHKRHGSLFNQGQVGSCTGNAGAGACNTEPLFEEEHHTILREAEALGIYEEATRTDNIPGSYPPDDTGSSGLAVAKVLRRRGFIVGYKHAFSVEEALDALMVKPWIIGMSWYEGFDTPDADGIITIGGQVRGGHEVVAREYEMLSTSPSPSDVVWFDNSWGTTWGRSGRFGMRVSTLTTLLAQQGDVTILH